MNFTKDSVTGIMPPMVTPFTSDESIDTEAFRREAQHLLGFDITALVVGGSTGEGATLRCTELVHLCELALTEAGGRVPVIAGVIVDSTREVIRRGGLLREIGVQALMVTPVHYLPPSEDGIFDFYQRIGTETGLPLIIYNVVSHVPVSPTLLERLVSIPQLVGIKESAAGSIVSLTEMLATLSEKIAVTWAWDQALLPGFVLGATGSISAINTVLPGLSVRLFDAVQKGHLEVARKLHFQMYHVARHLTHPNWHSAVKASINLQGRDVGRARSPSVPLQPDRVEAIRLGLLAAGTIQSVEQ